MKTIEIARRLAQLGEQEKAIHAYELVVDGDSEPAELLEAAAYILNNGGNYRISYTTFIQLYQAGYYRDEILPLMIKVFYEPNIRLLKNRYERNCKLLSKYPYLFRKDFIPFQELPVCFFPYDDHSGYVPLDLRSGSFLGFVNVKEQVITRNYFRDLEKPVLAEDVYSQYELEYLHDNVRPSEYIGRENHLYLHYSSWEDFCAWLQVLNVKPLLESKKIVFLIGEEIEQYPIDFKERFGIDYSGYKPRPVGIREVNRLIWHTQLSTHNGGDFFNEIFDYHPNLLCMPSIMDSNIEENLNLMRESFRRATSLEMAQAMGEQWHHPRLVEELFRLRDRTDKDYLVAIFLAEDAWNQGMDPNARIAPAVFFQPHFHNIIYQLRVNERGDTVLEAENLRYVHSSAMMGFKYIKTFTPMRRFTTSHGGTVRFMYESAQADDPNANVVTVVTDAISERILNRSFMRDPEDRLYKDSIVVRFEDGKLNPEATLTRLAAFLDLPYTETMTYCSEKGAHDPGKTDDPNIKYPYAAGFDPRSVYRTYDEYVNDSERKYIEFFLRDAYAFYGYDFQTYDGSPVDEATVEQWVSEFNTMDKYIRDTWKDYYNAMEICFAETDEKIPDDLFKMISSHFMDERMERYQQNRIENAKILLKGGLRFVNKNGQPLEMTPMLEPDPEKLVQPLYH